MDKCPMILMSDLTRGLINSDNFQDKFMIAELNCSRNKEEWDIPTRYELKRMDVLLLILVVEGSAQMTIDYIPYTIQKNQLITIMPSHVCQLNSIMPNFRAHMIIASHEFLDECSPSQGNRNKSVANYMEIRKNPCTSIEDSERHILERHLSVIREKINLKNHYFHNELIQNAFMGFLLDMANLFMKKNQHLTKPSLSRKEELMTKFLELLIENCREHHTVSFYAEKLFITPQYLSLILKDLSGKSTNSWIDETLIMEAKTMLKAPDATVQQVSDALCFSDQSTFGKFFKKHTGISPSKYRHS